MNEATKIQHELTGNQVIHLDYPIDVYTPNGEKKTIKTLEVRRLTVGDLRAVAHLPNDAEQELAMFSRVTGLVAEDLDKLDIADYYKLQTFFRTLQVKQ